MRSARSACARGNLQRFKTLLEGRGAETGGWRGSIPDRQETMAAPGLR